MSATAFNFKPRPVTRADIEAIEALLFGSRGRDAKAAFARQFNALFPPCDDPTCAACAERRAMERGARAADPKPEPQADPAPVKSDQSEHKPSFIGVQSKVASARREAEKLQSRFKPGSATHVYLEAALAGLESAALMAARAVGG